MWYFVRAVAEKAHSASVILLIPTSPWFALLDKLDGNFKASDGFACEVNNKLGESFTVDSSERSPTYSNLVLRTDFTTRFFSQRKWRLMTVIFNTVEFISQTHKNPNMKNDCCFYFNPSTCQDLKNNHFYDIELVFCLSCSSFQNEN